MALLEAGSAVGGRVRQLEGLAPWPLEMGPEFVHGGSRSVLVSLLKEVRAPFIGAPVRVGVHMRVIDSGANALRCTPGCYNVQSGTTAKALPRLSEGARFADAS